MVAIIEQRGPCGVKSIHLITTSLSAKWLIVKFSRLGASL